MAMIRCPECGAEISSRALNCIKCGCPINNSVFSTAVIKFEVTYAIRYTCKVICNGNEYVCKQGESVEIPLTEPTSVTVRIGGGSGSTTGTITPGRRYKVTNGMGMGLFGFKPILSAD